MRKIIHIDMDAFFVSVEIRDNPELADKPVAVGGSRVERGVLSTCNYIARKYGVRSAMPTSVALRLCPELILLPGRMAAYKEVSSQLREIFLRYTSIIEPLSLDEAYLDVTNATLHQGSATLIAEDIRATIKRELNLTASAGVAPIKFLAKVASDMNKPDGIFIIQPRDVDPFIDNMPLNKIPGVGKVSFEKLKDYKLLTGKDIKQTEMAWLVETFGKLGQLLWSRCHGIDERAIENSRIRKSVGVEHTFPYDIGSLEELTNILHDRLLPELKHRAKKHLSQRSIQKLGIKLKFSDFQLTTKEFSYSDFNSQLFESLLSSAFERGAGRKVRLMGAHLGLAENLGAEQYAFEW